VLFGFFLFFSGVCWGCGLFVVVVCWCLYWVLVAVGLVFFGLCLFVFLVHVSLESVGAYFFCLFLAVFFGLVVCLFSGRCMVVVEGDGWCVLLVGCVLLVRLVVRSSRCFWACCL